MTDKVLVVDDEPLILEITDMMLSREGYKVFTASTIKEALKTWRTNKIGIVLSDLNMNDDLDGLSLCSRIRSEDIRTIVIAITGAIDNYTLNLCLTVGFRDVIQKPIMCAELLSIMNCLVNQRERWKDML